MESSPEAHVVREGGCLCGHLRYRVEGLPAFPHTCSCRQCQRWSGAPLVGWADFPSAALAWTGPGGEPRWYRSSPGTRRGFCPACGSSLAAWDDGADSICLALGSLDDPGSVIPTSASFPDCAPGWLEVGMGRPRAAPRPPPGMPDGSPVPGS